MAMACAACKSRVEDGAVRCPNCGADLFRPGVFTQTIGWIVIALSLIPFAISLVTLPEGDYVAVSAGGAIVILGLVLIIMGRSKTRGGPPAVVADTSSLGPAGG